ncbi:MAG: GTP-binding protein [Gammaproteobacteria bacterium]|nr:GTP-binding protein [Gammaproteobacteria bacterium]MBI5616267.1 GTP-binding protein [Gammaproteobacteria bacterium]
MKKLTPVTILTGFLGSGKTTLLAHLLADPRLERTAVIINEFGEVSIDHLIVAKVAENVVELRNGCLCCTIRGDLALTLRDLYRQRVLEEVAPFERVIVETSGLADPVPLVHTLMTDPHLMRAFGLEAVVTVIDAQHAAQTLPEHETATNQLALADLVVLTKTDIASAEERSAAERLVAGINPQAECLVAVQGAIDPVLLVGRSRFMPDRRAGTIMAWILAHEHHDHATHYATHVITRPGPLSLAGTTVFLNHLVNQAGDSLLRIKGIAGFREKGGRPAILHAVRNKFYPVQWLDDWPDTDQTSRLVFIGRQLDAAWLDEKFASLCE